MRESGFAYFGQFVDHDITFDPRSMLGQQVASRALRSDPASCLSAFPRWGPRIGGIGREFGIGDLLRHAGVVPKVCGAGVREGGPAVRPWRVATRRRCDANLLSFFGLTTFR